DDGLDAEPLDGRRGLFPCAPAAEIATGEQDVIVAQPRRETLSQHLKGMPCQLLRVDVDQVAPGNDDVGVDVVAELEHSAFDLRRWHRALRLQKNSRGSAIAPRTAEAASVAGLDR